MNNNIKLKVYEIIKKKFKKKQDIQEDSHFIEDLNADSLDFIELSFMIEEQFKHKIPLHYFKDIKNIRELILYLEKVL